VLPFAGPALAAPAELPLGPRSLDERRAVARVAPGVRWTRIVREGGPWRVNVLTISPRARVHATMAGRAIGQRARPSAAARRHRAVAAINGGYFAGDGTPAGVLAAGGRLLSEPVGGRSALLPGSPSRVAAVRFDGTVQVGDETHLLDGVNRIPGEIPACGGRGGDQPTERPDASTTCTDPDEIVAFTPEWGGVAAAAAMRSGRTPPARGPRTDIVVRGGLVSSKRGGGDTLVPADGFVLAATGATARPLREAAQPGVAVQLDLPLRSGRLPLDSATPAGIVSGGPRLLAGGRVRVRSRAEGFNPLSAPWFHGSFVAARHPRTLAGVRADGRLLLVTVDGRRPGWSIGVSLPEAARLMRSLGARDALNLDGGGSTAMVVRGRTVNRPSDPTGERPVSDALVVLP
jgi:Phosphodiester glycosidase